MSHDRSDKSEEHVHELTNRDIELLLPIKQPNYQTDLCTCAPHLLIIYNIFVIRDHLVVRGYTTLHQPVQILRSFIMAFVHRSADKRNRCQSLL